MRFIRYAAAFVLVLTVAFIFPTRADADPQAATIQELKAQLDALKSDYEARIKKLEDELEQLQVQMIQAAPEEAPAAAQGAVVQSIPGALNPAIAVAANFVGRADNKPVFNGEGDRVDDKLNLREAEIDLRVPVDPYADGVLIASIESDTPGEFSTGVEEGYVNIKKLPFWEHTPLGLKLKVGRFRPDFGTTNVLHTHDLPTTFRPLTSDEFLGEDGYVGNGVSANFFIPTPDANSSLDATVDVLTGGDVAVSPQSQSPITYLTHLRWYRALGDANSLQLGYSGLFHPSNDHVGSVNTQGFDFLYRWKPLRQGEWKSYLLGGEVMFAPDTAVAQVADNKTPVGFTSFTQWQFNRRIYAGLRYDHTDTLANADLVRQSATPYISYYFSEFLRFRIDYEHRWSDLVEENGRNSVYFELNWIFGAHPPEPFWVNK